MKTSIHYSEEICKRLEAKKLTETISPYAMEYINTIMLAIFSTGYHGKTVDMEKCSDKHRTSISRFLHNDQWNASSLEKAMKELVIHTIYEEAERSGKPILCIVDDTIASKTKPSSKAIHPMQKYGRLDGTILHSDRGCQYTSYAFRRSLVSAGLVQSLSGTAHCYDNARMESFFATLKKEKLYQMPTYKMKRDEVKTIIFRYIFGYYNTQRINSFNEGGLPPVALRSSREISHHAA